MVAMSALKSKMACRSRPFQTVAPLGGIGGPQPSDFHSETGGVYVAFGCLAQQGYALYRPASRRRAGKERFCDGLKGGALSLMPQRFPREPAKRCFRAAAADHGFSAV